MASADCPCCQEPGTLTCKGCGDIKYCSGACQEADWQFHKMLCKSVKDFKTPPEPGMLRVVYFPPTGAKPEFRWLHRGDPSVDRSLNDGKALSSYNVYYDAYTEVPVRTMIEYYFDDNFMANYKQPNDALYNATNRKSVYNWCGPIIAVCCGKDMDMASYSALIRFFVNYMNQEPGNIWRKGEKIKGIKMNCDGERRVNGVPPAVPVELPRMHPIFDTPARVSDISKRISMPLVVRKFPAKQSASDQTGDHCIHAVTFMMQGCDPSKRDSDDPNEENAFGWAPLSWTGGRIPNVFISREKDERIKSKDSEDDYDEDDDSELDDEDTTDLDADIINAFGDYCRWHLVSWYEWEFEIGRDYPMRREEVTAAVMEQITPEKWAEYLGQWRRLKAHEARPEKDNGVTADFIEGVARMGLTQVDSDKLEDRLWRCEGR